MEFKQTYSITRWEIYNGVIILYDGIARYAYEMIKEYYSGEEWEGTAFLLTPAYGFDFSISRPITRESLKGICDPYGMEIRRVVFWNFDHLQYPGYLETLNRYLEELSPDEIWEWQVEIYKENPYTLKDRVRFMPMRYVSVYGDNKIDRKDPKFDFAFLGNIMGRRSELLGSITSIYGPIKIMTGYDMEDLKDELSICKAVLNIHGISGNYREQLRISECLCRNLPVLTETDSYPYYPGLTGEYDYDLVMSDITNLYKALNNVPTEISNKYKILTQTDSDYESYKNSILYYY